MSVAHMGLECTAAWLLRNEIRWLHLTYTYCHTVMEF